MFIRQCWVDPNNLHSNIDGNLRGLLGTADRLQRSDDNLFQDFEEPLADNVLISIKLFNNRYFFFRELLRGVEVQPAAFNKSVYPNGD